MKESARPKRAVSHLAIQEAVVRLPALVIPFYYRSMIVRLTGQVLELNQRSIVLDVHGVGFQVFTPGALLHKLQRGETLSVHTYHHVTDDGETLFGFETKEDLAHFELLLTVPSVGPKTAMNVLDAAPPHVLAQAVANNDMKLLTKVSGIGRKTAERILVELREKFKNQPVTGLVSDIHDQTLTALISIGFNKTQARLAVQKLPANVGSVEEAVRAILKDQS